MKQSIDYLDKMVNYKNDYSKLKSEIDQWTIEKQHFDNYYQNNNNYQKIDNLSKSKVISLNQIISFRTEYEMLLNKKDKLSLFNRIKLSTKYKVSFLKLSKYTPVQIKDYCQNLFYIIKIDELNHHFNQIDKELKAFNIDTKTKEYCDLSLNYFNNYLYSKYINNDYKYKTNNDLLNELKISGNQEFFKYYPVVINTTFSIRKGFINQPIYDYVIIDEASQVDIVSGFLALTVAKNIVIVGDTKQLSNIVTKQNQDSINNMLVDNNLLDSNLNKIYNFSNNLLNTINNSFSNVISNKKRLLKEHYRCHPKIINFCNKSFYNNELIILTNNKDIDKPLCIYQTTIGNHCTKEKVNQREIDVIVNEVFKKENLFDYKGTIGIIAPYKNQIKVLSKYFANHKNIQVSTVNKFQGKECDVIIFCTVDNSIGDFVSEYNRINVAISRAKDKFILVTNGNENKYTIIDELKQYIQYNNFDIINSEIRSIFDPLFLKENNLIKVEMLKKYNKKLINKKYDSPAEMIMEEFLNNFLKEHQLDNYLSIQMHINLIELLNKNNIDLSIFNQEEYNYIKNKAHVDFLLTSKNTGQIILAIEVDGENYHNSEVQKKRDILKNQIFKKSNIPFSRFTTREEGDNQEVSENKTIEEQKLKKLINNFVIDEFNKKFNITNNKDNSSYSNTN